MIDEITVSLKDLKVLGKQGGKRDAQVIARKVKTPSGMELRLTGRGYNRQTK